jgi:hypothetical protein
MYSIDNALPADIEIFLLSRRRMPSSNNVTLLLVQLCKGDEAADRLIPRIYAELRRTAHGYM